MSDYSLDDLNASADVVWDYGVSGDLARSLDSAATTVEDQIGPRNARKTTSGTHFVGYYADLWVFNVGTANQDARLLAERLRSVAQGVRDLEADARAEQDRINAAREWKRQRDSRSGFDEFLEDIDFLHLFHGEAAPPRMEPIPQMNKTYDAPPKGLRREFAGSRASEVSSALPDDLRSFTSGERGATDLIRHLPAQLQGLVADFRAKCQWGRLDCDAVLTGFSAYIASNDLDCQRLDVVASNFEAAGGSGVVSTVPNSAIGASLAANGISEQRVELEIPAVQAIGNPPTSGYSNDPVNTATGNFVENEEDLRFGGASALLGWARSYSSLSARRGAHGVGWASFAEAGLRFDSTGATWRMVDGREVFFPRSTDGFERAQRANYWLTVKDDGTGFVITNNTGARWVFDAAGVPVSLSTTEGATLYFTYEDACLVRVHNVWGRWIDVEWDDDLIVAVVGSDGRRVDYVYEGERLVEARTPGGVRRYEWNDEGLISAVIDGDGVVEARNTYDEMGRVVTQVSQYGRLTRFSYLSGRVTAVSDADGGRGNTWVADKWGRLVAVTDCDGNTQRMSWDPWGNQVLAVAGDGSQTVRVFDDRGRLVTEVDADGTTMRMSYDERDRLTSRSVSDAGGEEITSTTLEYVGEQSQPSVVIDGEGGRTQLTWQRDLLHRVVDPMGVVVEFTYDEHGDMVAHRDGAGNETRMVRDQSGHVIETMRPSGALTRYEYTDAGLLAARIDPDGARWVFEYTAGGRLSTVINPLGARSVVEAGEHGEVSAVIDALGRRVSQEFDDLGNVSKVVMPDGAAWEFTHDAMSRVTQMLDPSGGLWSQSYAAAGQRVESVDPTGVVTAFTTDRAKRQQSAGGVGREQTLSLNAWGLPEGITGAGGAHTRVRYDRAGRPVEFVDAAGGLTRVDRDAAGRPTRVRTPGGATTRYEYDECGRICRVVNALGFATTVVYDVDSQVVEEHGPAGERAWRRYDVCGRLSAQHVPGAGTWRWVYDAAGRVVETKDPQWGLRRFRYDEADQLVAVTGGTGGVTSYEYDANGRAIRVIDPLGGVSTRTFDAMNRCTSQTTPLGDTSYASYDEAGRFVRNVDADGRTIDIAYEDDGLTKTLSVDGRLFSRTSIDPAARTRTVEDYSDPTAPITHVFSYDLRGLCERYERGGQVTSWAYDADGHVSAVTTPNGQTTIFERGAFGVVSRVSHPGLPDAVFEYDQAGRPLQVSAGDESARWEYKDGFPVSHTLTTGGGQVASTMAYTEDGLLAQVTTSGQTTRYFYDEAAQMRGAQGPDGASSWTYDQGGRLTHATLSGITWEGEYNAAGQLISAASKNARMTYSYDRSGRRISQTHMMGSKETTTVFEWSTLGRLTSIRKDASGHHQHLNVDALGHVRSVDGLPVICDEHGGVRQLGEDTLIQAGPLCATSSGGWMMPSWRPGRDTQAHNPYQAPAVRVSVNTGGAGRVGVGSHGELRLQGGYEWMGARVYDPASALFLSPDPLEPVTGAGWVAHPYAYAGNNPVNLFDPAGLRPITTEELDAYRKANAPKWGTALAIVAGVGLAFVPGAQGFAAALIAGAVLGGGASIIDQACSGYPIDWGQVGKDTLFGLGGGAFGYGVGKGLQWAAKTPVGQAATQWVGDQAQRIPVVQHITNRLGARSAAETAESLTDDALNALTTPARTAPTPELPTPPVPPRPATIHFDGVDYPGVPEGAVGTLARKGKGMIYDIPPGTDGLHPSITSVRVMEPTHGKYPYPHGYAGYFRGKQPAHPGTGRTVDRSDPAWHIPLTPEQGWP